MNIKDIAKLTNVSIATVSRVINNKAGVRDEVRKKIEKIIIETGYRPNLLARSLVNKKSAVIGLMIPRFDGYYSERVEAVLKNANEKNYGVMIASAVGKYIGEIDNIYMLQEKQVEGIIYFVAKYTKEHIKVLENLSKIIPIVLVDLAIEGIDAPCVLQDNYNGAKKAMEYLIDCGHKNIAYIGSPYYDPEGAKRYKAYLDVMKKNNISVNDDLVSFGTYSIASGTREIEKILSKAKVRPTAIFAANDNMAIGAIAYLNKEGIKVPEDISVIGFDDIRMSEHISPPLTTVKQDQSEIGIQASNLLFELINNKSVKIKKIILEQELIIRKSVRKI